MVSSQLLAIVRCPDCRGALAGEPTLLTCQACGRQYPSPGADHLDLRPARRFPETTKYTDQELHADARHEVVSPPLLGAGVRQAVLREFLTLGPTDRVVDLGCGSGRVLVWNREVAGYVAGIDVSPFFAAEAQRSVDLLLGDLRRLPFADETFTKALSLDVQEHLSRDALADSLREAARVLVPGGHMFVYSHVRKNSPLAAGLHGINRLAAILDRWGYIDLSREHLRKSDHLNVLADLDDLRGTVAAAGFRIARLRFYTSLIGGVVENLLVRLVERWLERRAARALAGAPREDASQAARVARATAKARIAKGGATYRALQALTWLMKLDLLLFGRIPSGPFFALLVKERDLAMQGQATYEDSLRRN